MKINKIAGSLALIASLATVSSIAQASTTSYQEYNLGVLTSLSTDSGDIFVAYDDKFTHKFNFSVLTLSEVSTSASDIPLKNTGASKITFVWKRAIPNLTMSLYTSKGIQIGSTTDSGVSSDELLSSGAYYALVEGLAIGSQGGKYSVTMAAEPAAVPVPAAAWLLGSGLIGLVAVGRRKEQA